MIGIDPIIPLDGASIAKNMEEHPSRHGDVGAIERLANLNTIGPRYQLVIAVFNHQSPITNHQCALRALPPITNH